MPTLPPAAPSYLLDGFASITPAAQADLLAQIGSVDWPEVERLVRSHVLAKPAFEAPGEMQPPPWFPALPTDAKLLAHYAVARAEGERLLRAGKVAAFTVAGGQGSRLGWDAPKGTFPATPIRKASLFQCFAEYLQKAAQKYGRPVPWYILTSTVNDAATRAFFDQNGYFGLDKADVVFFTQAMMPAFDMLTGRVLMESPGQIALSPNGHGGSLKAMWASGAIADMKKRGVEQISYVQVDNPLLKLADPLFIGLHALAGAEMSSKALAKAHPKEKVGLLCLANGKMQVIEYSNLPDALAEERAADGSLRFKAGSIAMHMLRVDFVEGLNTAAGGFSLPWNRAEKKVAYFDFAAQKEVKPEKTNAVKLETFVFDALPFCKTSIILEVDRDEEFGPIKNADAPAGAPVMADSPASATLMQTFRAARWLEAAGVSIPRKADGGVDAVIELPQTVAIEPGDLAGRPLPKAIAPGARVLVG